MKLVFVRHGEGEHNVDVPRSWNLVHPRLTEVGRQQVAQLGQKLAITERDLLLVSPTRRTIETSLIITAGSAAPLYVSPAVGPRMFPQNPAWPTLPCDRLLEPAAIGAELPQLKLLSTDDAKLWRDGINTLAQASFAALADGLIAWCRGQPVARALIVAHDGTVHSYRERLGEENLSRESFLGPAGSWSVEI